MQKKCPIGVFDSGFGGLTILNSIREQMPEYDYLYLGDNARAPYGSRSFDIVYEFTLQAVEYLFAQDVELVILACNTASAKALRTIQQKVLPVKYPNKRVLGVIRPSTEDINRYTKTNKIGILATEGTTRSESYVLEIHKYHPNTIVFQQACPLWVPLIENGDHTSEEAQAIFKKDVEKLLQQASEIDTIILACTHYPIIYSQLREIIPASIRLIAQGEIVATKLQDYLNRHTEIESKISKNGTLKVLTTEETIIFDEKTQLIFGQNYHSETIHLL
jgi:glutamate racemase